MIASLVPDDGTDVINGMSGSAATEAISAASSQLKARRHTGGCFRQGIVVGNMPVSLLLR